MTASIGSLYLLWDCDAILHSEDIFKLCIIFFVLAGKILDQYRIDVTLATMYNIIERGGRYNTY
jgi:hypothetical protein